jgi:hypothetical protein
MPLHLFQVFFYFGEFSAVYEGLFVEGGFGVGVLLEHLFYVFEDLVVAFGDGRE